jgi:hypothetical protein
MDVKKYACILIGILFFSYLSAQNQVLLDLNISVPDAESFYIGDLDFIQKNSNKLIFTLTIQNPGNDATGRFRISVVYRSQTTSEELISAITNAVTVPAGANWTITNVELNKGINLPTPSGGTVYLEIEDYTLNFDRLQFIQDYVQKTNKLPGGEYLFNLFFNDIPDQNPSNNQLLIRNPSFVQLSFPGTDISNPNPPSIPTIAPIFQWFSDAGLFDLYIYEMKPTDQTFSDIFSHEEFAIIRNINKQHFQYPIVPGNFTLAGEDGVQTRSEGELRPLDRGKTYAWFVEAKIPTAVEGQFETIKSPIYVFKVRSSSFGNLKENQILMALQMILGENYDKIISGLKGYSPGPKILLDGKQLTPEELINLAIEVQRRKFLIDNITIE